MNHSQTFDDYPAWIVILCNAVSWAIYAVGAYVLARVSIWLAVPYLVYILWLEARLLRNACVDCAYYGKMCAFGRGKICGAVFQRGDAQRFSAREVSWKDMIPDLLVSLIPLAGGILLLVLNGWDWLIAGLLLLLLILASSVTGLVRGNLACKYCRQKDLGCPAYELFGGEPDA